MNSNVGGRSLRGLAAKLRELLGRGAADESGAAAIFFAVTLLLLAPMTLGLVDVYMATTQRGQLQDALDTATLYVARSKETDADKIKQMGHDVLVANLNLPDGQEVASYDFQLIDGRKIVSSAAITPPNFSPSFWDQDNLKATSEVTRNSVNLEVALVLDTTGSMSGQIANLRTAAKDLVDLVVQDDQSLYYSKVALVPYSVGVNLGNTYAATARGADRPATTISGATKASPVVITSTDHGLANGEAVYITGVKGMTELNTKEFVAANVTANTFQLKNSDGSNVNGTGYKKYTSAGSAQCRGYGCNQTRITTTDGVSRLFNETNCATERVGGDLYTEAPPSTRTVGRHYQASSPASDTACVSAVIEPLTASKTTLKNKIDTLAAAGSTGGHIGLAWGWYTISPEWSGVWSGSSVPAAYTKPETVKVVILMTDGEFNTTYCKGVNSSDGFGGSSSKINCSSTNGNVYTQAASLCANMKAAGVVLYTVGFNVSNSTNVKNLLTNCASSPSNVYLPSSGTALKDAFKAISQDINKLRISK